jgi:serine protease Do
MMRNKKNSTIVWLWLLFGVTLLFPLAGDAGVSEKTFPIPLQTVTKAVVTWLQNTGFQLHTTTHSNPNRTDIRAEKTTERWYIQIRPQSALACHINAHWDGPVQVTPNNSDITDPYKPLWAGIQKYIQSSNLSHKNTPPAIPEAVFTHIKAIVCIHTTTGETQKQVSGFFINAGESLVISTAHDLMALQEVSVQLSDSRNISGQVVQLDPAADLALIRVESSPQPGISLTQTRNLLNMGDRLYTIGCPSGRRGVVTPGIVNAPPRRAAGQLLWQVKMKILHGNSGSPVFDEQGRLVAVVKGRHRKNESVGFLIPMETVIAFIKASIDYVRLTP